MGIAPYEPVPSKAPAVAPGPGDGGAPAERDQAQPASGRGRAQSYVWRLFVEQREITPLLITIVLFVYFTATSPSAFPTSLGLGSAAGYAGPFGALAAGEVLVLVLGEIDLSSGQIFLLAPWVMYWLWQLGVPVGFAMAVGLFVAAGVGALNGLITVLFKVPSFVTTLATNFAMFGIVLIFSNDTEATPIPGAVPPTTSSGVTAPVGFFSQFFGVWQWSEILWVAGLALGAHFVLRRTRFGVRVISTGGNQLGAAEAGVPIRRVKVLCFVISGLVAGSVGIVDAIKYGSLDPGNAGINYILYAVGACVIGGTALTGGRGTVIGAFIGAALIGVLEAGLTIIGVSTNDFYVWIGVVMIAAMILNTQLDRLAARRRTT